MPDYIPRTDPEFESWEENFITAVSSDLAAYGLVAADLTPVNNAQAVWHARYPMHVSSQAAAQAARIAKDEARAEFEAALRTLARKIQGQGVAGDEQKMRAGLPVRDTQPTPAEPATTRPVGQVDTSQRFQHTVSFRDEGTPTSKAKPAGVRGCELWVKIGGAAPVDPSECAYAATDTNSPYTFTFEGADAGKTAHWMLRWVSTRGEPGPWSETVSATIPG